MPLPDVDLNGDDAAYLAGLADSLNPSQDTCPWHWNHHDAKRTGSVSWLDRSPHRVRQHPDLKRCASEEFDDFAAAPAYGSTGDLDEGYCITGNTEFCVQRSFPKLQCCSYFDQFRLDR